MKALAIVHTETREAGSRVQLQSPNNLYMAIVAANGEVTELRVGVPWRNGVWWRCNRFARGIPERVQNAVREALAY